MTATKYDGIRDISWVALYLLFNNPPVHSPPPFYFIPFSLLFFLPFILHLSFYPPPILSPFYFIPFSLYIHLIISIRSVCIMEGGFFMGPFIHGNDSLSKNRH
jgi:hypothetical protein